MHAANGKGHGMHSPFLFGLITDVLNDKKKYPAYSQVEHLRQAMRREERQVNVEDFGAGSTKNNSRQRTVRSIARHAAKPAKYGQLLFRMTQYYQPATILELGTSLGITTSYLAKGQPRAKLVTIEGAPVIAELAQENMNSLGLTNVMVKQGRFESILPGVLEKMPTIDFAFIDGNHRRQPTELYFHQLLPHLHNDSILVFDDIHWSREMEEAWETIKGHHAVRCTVDLFFIGLVFFRREFHEKLDVAIRF